MPHSPCLLSRLPSCCPSSAMTALPSFVELMASLGLENNKTDTVDSHPHSQHSRSSSYSSTCSVVSRSSTNNPPQPQLVSQVNGSPSIVISRHPSSSSLSRESDSERRRSRTRYSPYSPSIVSALPSFHHFTPSSSNLLISNASHT